MHYYQFNIADYRKDTTHLSRLEHSIYRDLIDMYYLDEKPIQLETSSVMRRLRLVSEEEAKALENVLSDFFERTPQGYAQKRIQSEINAWNNRGWIQHDQSIQRTRPPIDEWKETRNRIFIRDDFTCGYCGTRGGALECDHKNPVSLGGSNDDDNLITACKPCNRKKCAMPFDEWIEYMRHANG